MSPRPGSSKIREHYSRAGQYDRYVRELAQRLPIWRMRWELVRRHVAADSAQPLRLLDVGAGIGEWIAQAPAGFDCIGLEPSGEGVRLAAELFQIRLQQGGLDERSYPPASFDVVTIWHVLEHLPDPGAALRRLLGLLRPGGYLVLAVPNGSRLHWLGLLQEGIKNPVRRLFTAIDGKQRKPYRPYGSIDLGSGEEIHLTHFTQKTLLRALSDLACTIRYAGPDPCARQLTPGMLARYHLAQRSSAWLGRHGFEAILVIARKPATPSAV